MSKYIDADKLINELNNSTQNTWGKGLGRSWWSHSVKLKDNIVECINKQPTADVVEVVRCKDCEHSYFIKSCSKYECRKDGGVLKYSTDFCSYGKRRMNDTIQKIND